MDAFASDSHEMVVFCCASQMGKTELIFAVIGKMLTDGPRVPCMYLGPTEKQVRSVSKQRIAQMIASTPALDALHQKGRFDSISEKFFAGGTRFGFAHAGSATEVASHPCGLVMTDEYSRMAEIAGEGDPMLLAKARTKNFRNGKVGVFSTPTVRGVCATWNWFLEGTREMWSWQCLHCREWFVPRRSLLVWPEDATPREARLAAVVACPHCGAEIRTQDRETLPAKYIPHDVDEDWNFNPCKLEPNAVRSFWASGLASPWRSFGQIAEAIVRVAALGDGSLQTVINTELGEPFEVSGDAPMWSEVREHGLPYNLGDVPYGVQIITCGVDVQKRGLYYVIRGFGYGGASWLIDRGTIHGDTSRDTVWNNLDTMIKEEIAGWNVDRTFVDSGWRPGDKYARPKNVIYEFCKHKNNVYPTKGQENMDKAVNAALVDTSARGKTLKSGTRLFHINTHHWKSWVYDKIRMPVGSPEAFFVPESIDDEYCRQVTSEQLVIEERRFRWIPHYRHNHYLDCEVLAVAAAYTLGLEELSPLAEPGEGATPIERFKQDPDFEPREL